MKLVELLAKEWREWPHNCDHAVCDSDGEIRAIGTGTHHDFYPSEAVDVEDRLSGTALLVSHDGKTVTRADWEKEKMKQAAPKKNAEGWIRHRGGKCPLKPGVMVDVRYRDSIVSLAIDCDDLRWGYIGDSGDIMAYRLHKPAEETADEKVMRDCVEKCASTESASQLLYDPIAQGPLQWRDRIAEIDATSQALTTERAELVQKLASEGFALIGRVPDAPIGLPRDEWKVGDLVILKCKSPKTGMPAGKPLPITEFDGSPFGQDVKVDGVYFPMVSDLTWHSRPSA